MIKIIGIITLIQATLLFSLNDFEETNFPILVIFLIVFVVNLIILSNHKDLFMEENDD